MKRLDNLRHAPIEERISGAISNIFHLNPFFGTLLASTPVVPNSNLHIKTAATDGRNIFYDEAFMASKDAEGIEFVLLHEIVHIILNHADRERIGGRVMGRWNRAADYVTNAVLQSTGRTPEPDALFDTSIATADSLVEKVYEDLPEAPKCDGKCKLEDLSPDGTGDVECTCDISDLIPSDLSDEDKAKVRQNLARAYELGKAAGKLPAGIEELVDGILRPKLPWRVHLMRYVKEVVGRRDDYSYSRPNKRYTDVVLPSATLGSAIARAVVAIDSSGSVSSEELREFAGETEGVRSLVSSLLVLACDTEVSVCLDMEDACDKITSLQVRGRGGTLFKPVFDYVEKHERPDILIYMTDGYGDFPRVPPPYPVIWLINNKNVNPPWGTVLRTC